ncbi:disulfide bond formation protein B [Ancylobacter defluvii]|uniref:Disulfide bond formation protein DsbB n=1 Tax=Ancylobacter defluvii TaxID=1282440 RepID=A0A9W6N9A7_9HYPH|nr:disulfide bond formation protein B [Ancylobacter defluvii]MBS7586163.1 disulfide bond formation protein B [Ancylobacter defluvii]GLK82360.1 disulfide bond formation protein DsbB [Ancylobacter defluvii]
MPNPDMSSLDATAGFRRPLVLAALIIAAGAAATLAGAWFFQLVIGLAPCPLCLEQRLPYYAAVPLGLVVAMVARQGHVGMARAGLTLLGLLMLIGFGLALYHAGVEWHWWQGPTACSGGAPATSANLLQDLQQARVVRCDEAPWRWLGLSLAGWNVLIAATLTLAAAWGVRRR